jgi:hypothetical protein
MKKWMFWIVLCFVAMTNVQAAQKFQMYQPVYPTAELDVTDLKVPGVVALKYYNVLLPKGSKTCEEVSQKLKDDFYRRVKIIENPENGIFHFRWGACYFIPKNEKINAKELWKIIYKKIDNKNTYEPVAIKKDCESAEKKLSIAYVCNYFQVKDGDWIEMYFFKNTEYGLQFSYFIVWVSGDVDPNATTKQYFLDTFKPYMEGIL